MFYDKHEDLCQGRIYVVLVRLEGKHNKFKKEPRMVKYQSNLD